MLKRLREGSAAANRTLEALHRLLPVELAAQVWGAVIRDGTLTVFVRSAAWGTRLRYLAPRFTDALAAELGIELNQVKVKVRAGRS